MAEPTTNYIEIDGEGKWIEDTEARENTDWTDITNQLDLSVFTDATKSNIKIKKCKNLLSVSFWGVAVKQDITNFNTPLITNLPKGDSRLFIFTSDGGTAAYINFVRGSTVSTITNGGIALYTNRNYFGGGVFAINN